MVWEGSDREVTPYPDYELFLEHCRKKRVARVLNERGYRTREGNLWSDTTLDRLIRDPTAKGLHRANYTTNDADNTRQIKPEDDWVWTPVEPIVSEELWEQCNAILENRRLKWAKVGKRPVHLFAGLTYCACGTKMYVLSSTPKYVCAECRNKIPIVDLEAIFYEQLKSFFLSPSEVAEHLEQADEHLAEKKRLLQVLRKERDDLRQEIQRTYRLYADHQLEGEAFAKLYKPLEERQRQLDEEVPRLEAEADALRVNHFSEEQLASESKDLYARWPSLTHDEKQSVIESITEKIVIGDGEVDITLCHSPFLEPMTKEQRKLTPAAETPAAPPAASSSSRASLSR